MLGCSSRGVIADTVSGPSNTSTGQRRARCLKRGEESYDTGRRFGIKPIYPRASKPCIRPSTSCSTRGTTAADPIERCGRICASGPSALEMQDRSTWDRDLIAQGFHFLEKASTLKLSEYHLEAGIAALHCVAPAYEDTDWAKILDLYEMLYGLRPSPIVALNRAIAVGNTLGPDEGLAVL